MHRRSILCGVLPAIGGTLAGSRARAASEASSPPAKPKVVYHLSDLDEVNFVLGNLQKHFDGVGGPENVTIALVIHGPALRAFHSASANPYLSRRVQQFSGDGVELAVCGNTMKSQNVSLRSSSPASWSPSRASSALPSCSRRATCISGPEPVRRPVIKLYRVRGCIKNEGSNPSGWSCPLPIRIFPLTALSAPC
ncbi:hypothetical protein J6497_14370 [Bradyrhizobium sp. CNPSo 4026]|nr:hypothetical protein [Bradyrhizobium cenepequi]